MNQKIRIKLKSYDHNLVDKSSEKIVRAVKATGANATGANTNTAERQRANASSLSSLKTSPDRPDPLILQSEREMSLPTIILKHTHDTASTWPQASATPATSIPNCHAVEGAGSPCGRPVA